MSDGRDLTPPAGPAREAGWLLASLACGLIPAVLTLYPAWSRTGVAADDARQHVFWMLRLQDPGAFPHDRLADYFQAVAPVGYQAVYGLLAKVGVTPLVASLWLPLVLGLGATLFTYGIARCLSRNPIAGLAGCLLLNAHLWRHDDLASATPRAFAFPLFLGFLYFLLRGSWKGAALMVAGLGLTYPQVMLVALGVLLVRLVQWDGGPRLTADRTRWAFGLSAIAASLATIVPFLDATRGYGPVITAAEAAGLAEFQKKGRSAFFTASWWEYWVVGPRSGLLRYLPSSSPMLALGALLPLLGRLAPKAAWEQARPGLIVLGQVVAVSVGLYVASHLLLFRLHLPSRYTMHTVWMAAAIAGGLAVALMVDALHRRSGPSSRPIMATVLTLLLGLSLWSPGRAWFDVGLRAGPSPDLYRFLAKQPPDSLVASLSLEADYIPLFAGRSVFFARELAIPYHQGYFRTVRSRAEALIQAQYSPDPSVLDRFNRDHGIRFWLIDKDAYSQGYVNHQPVLRQYLPRRVRETMMVRQTTPALARMAASASVFESTRLQLIDVRKLNARGR
jgi:hypothetical protein